MYLWSWFSPSVYWTNKDKHLMNMEWGELDVFLRQVSSAVTFSSFCSTMSERFPSLSSLRDGLRFRCCQSRGGGKDLSVRCADGKCHSLHNAELSLPSKGLLKCHHDKHVLNLCYKVLQHRNLFHSWTDCTKRVSSLGPETFTGLTYHFKAKQHALQPVNLLS